MNNTSKQHQRRSIMFSALASLAAAVGLSFDSNKDLLNYARRAGVKYRPKGTPGAFGKSAANRGRLSSV